MADSVTWKPGQRLWLQLPQTIPGSSTDQLALENLHRALGCPGRWVTLSHQGVAADMPGWLIVNWLDDMRIEQRQVPHEWLSTPPDLSDPEEVETWLSM